MQRKIKQLVPIQDPILPFVAKNWLALMNVLVPDSHFLSSAKYSLSSNLKVQSTETSVRTIYSIYMLLDRYSGCVILEYMIEYAEGACVSNASFS